MAHNSSSQYGLLTQRRFGPFFLAQLSGAFNDSLFKQILVLLVTYHAADYSADNPGLLTNLAAGIFILPFVLFSALAGQLADKYDKARMIQGIKGAEVAIMGLASWGFFSHSLPLLLSSLFLMGCHSAFFGPAKYAVLPQTLAPDELVGGNGLLEMGTFLAILTGTLCAGLLVAATTDPALLSCVLTAMAALGLLFSLGMPRMVAPAPELKLQLNPWRQTMDMVRQARKTRSVWLSLLGISWFWFFGATVLSQIPAIGKSVLQGSEQVVTVLLAVFSVGVAIGSMLCEKLSGRRVEIGLVPFGSIGLSVFAADLYFALQSFTAHVPPATLLDVHAFLALPASWRVLVDIALVGVFGGFYIVPLYALVQTRTDKSEQSRIIAVNNILNAVFMVAAAGFAAAALHFGASVPVLIALCAGLNALVAVYIYGLVPEFLWRFLGWMLAHTFYRLRLEGRDRIPQEGAALLCPNHVSYADALFLSALSPRPIRFVMDHGIFQVPVAKWLFRSVKAIPIASGKTHPEVLAAAYEAIDQALANGELVCVFPEGMLTRDGQMNPFKPGVCKVLERRPVPVVPVAIQGLWGSVFSRTGKTGLQRLMGWKPLRKVALSVGEAMPPQDVSPQSLQGRVSLLLTA